MEIDIPNTLFLSKEESQETRQEAHTCPQGCTLHKTVENKTTAMISQQGGLASPTKQNLCRPLTPGPPTCCRPESPDPRGGLSQTFASPHPGIQLPMSVLRVCTQSETLPQLPLRLRPLQHVSLPWVRHSHNFLGHSF